jgi:hypothetical protein
MKRLVVMLGTAALLVGMIGGPTDAAPKPDVTTVSGDITFVDTDSSTTVHAVFDYQRLSSPNGSMTVTVGGGDPVTIAPVAMMDGGPVYDDGSSPPIYDIMWLNGFTTAGDEVLLTMYTEGDGTQHASWSLIEAPAAGYGGTVTSGEYTVYWPKVPKPPKQVPFAMTVDATGSSLASPVVLTGTVTGMPFDGASLTITVPSLTSGVPLATTYVFTLPKGSVTAYGYSTATSTGGSTYLIEASETGWYGGTGKYADSMGEFQGPIGTLTYLGGGALTLHAELVGTYTK